MPNPQSIRLFRRQIPLPVGDPPAEICIPIHPFAYFMGWDIMRIRLDLSWLPVKSLITLRNQAYQQLGIDPAFEEAARMAIPNGCDRRHFGGSRRTCKDRTDYATRIEPSLLSNSGNVREALK
jgi:hypothetical protein